MNPNISFQELSKLQREALAKQKPVSYEQAKEQVLRVKIKSTSKNKEQKKFEVEETLKLQNPDWTKEQINVELVRLYKKYNESL